MKNWLLLICLLFPLLGTGQGDPQILKGLAKELMVHANYEDALATLRRSDQLRYRDKEGQLLIAICQYQLNALDEAERGLAELVENEKDAYPEAFLYLAKIYHARHQFTEASRLYKTYLRRIGDHHPSRAVVLDELRRCANGIRFQYQERKAFVENMGSGVNSKGDEFGAVASPNYERRVYFSSRRRGNIGGPRNPSGQLDERYGQFYSDIYSATNEQGGWGAATPLHYLLNSPRHEVILGFNADGSAMYYFQGDAWEAGNIMVDTYQEAEEQLLTSNPFAGPVDARVDQAAPHYYDRATVIFPSRRAGGYGGYDLYITTLSNGRWSTPENLGPDINSPYNETTPYLAKDGITLFFSSDHPERSIGGYDIFRTTYLSDRRRWLPPENMRIPINSAGDDTHFHLARDGFSAFLTSSRKDGFGLRDLYIAYFDFFLEEQEPPMALENTYFHQFRRSAPSAAPSAAPPPVPSAPAQSVVPPPSDNIMEVPREGRGNEAALLDFEDRWDISDPEHRALMTEIANALLAQPGTRLIVEVYAESGPLVSERLYKAVEAVRGPVGDFFVTRGVAPGRIYFRAGLRPPAQGKAGKSYALGFHLYNAPNDTPSESENELSQKLKGLHPPPLLYRVKVATLNNLFSGSLMDDFPVPVVEYRMSRRLFHYLSGAFSSFEEAGRWKSALGERGMGYAEIIPYINGWPATDAMVRENLEKLPDLQGYLKAQSK